MEIHELNDILADCVRQDRRSQEKLYNYTYQKLIGTAMRYAGSREDAKWVFNLAMMKVYKNIEKFKIGTNFLGWANDILIKTSIDNIRKNTRHQRIMAPVDSSFVEGNKVTLNEALNSLATEKIMEMVQRLGEKERMVFSLYVIDGFKHKEIAEMTGINMNTCKWLLGKAKKELKEMIGVLNEIRLSK